jgi:hypothetical protein
MWKIRGSSLEWWGQQRPHLLGRLRAEVICRMIVLPPGCDVWQARPDGRSHELYLSPRGQMRIGQPDVDRADAEDRDHHGLFDAVRHAVIMEGPRGSLDITACRHRHSHVRREVGATVDPPSERPTRRRRWVPGLVQRAAQLCHRHRRGSCHHRFVAKPAEFVLATFLEKANPGGSGDPVCPSSEYVRQKAA